MRRLLVLLLLLASPALGVDAYGLGDTVGAGYTARANGMDLDDDFSYGEVGVDDLACDSATNLSAGPIAEDVDGNDSSVLEAQIYVRPGVGTDNSSCGGTSTSSSGGACATVQYVIDNRLNTQAGEDYICLYTGDGTNAVEQLSIGEEDGDAGTKTRTAVGLEQFNYEYPSNPNVIMGADWDNDGEYPPYDTDDSAVFDGENTLYYFIKENDGGFGNDTDRWEYAHFEVIEYGDDDSAINRQAAVMGSWETDNLEDPEYSSHIYRHDIEMTGINRGLEPRSSIHFMQVGWQHRYKYNAIENINCLQCCGYVTRGSVGGSTAEYLRVRNTTFDDFDCETTAGEVTGGPNGPTGPKIWGKREGMEWIYNYWDFNSDNFYIDNGISCTSAGFAIVDNCQRDVYILGNSLRNAQNAVVFGGGLERGCQEQNADNFHFAYNEVIWDDLNCADANAVAVQLQTSYDDPEWFSEDKYIYNNLFSAPVVGAQDIGIAIYSNNGVPVGGSGDPSAVQHVVVGNTFYSDDWSDGPAHYIIKIDIEGDKANDWVISNNIFAGGTDNEYAVRIDSVDDFTSDYNIWETPGNLKFNWLDQDYLDLPQFAAASSSNTNSKGEGQNPCLVTFENSPSDLHLDTADTCAKGAGSNMSAYYSDDYDLDARPQDATWEVGADEVSGSYVPEGACCTAGACELTIEGSCGGDAWLGAGTTCDPNLCTPPGGQPVDGFAEGVTLSGVKKQ